MQEGRNENVDNSVTASAAFTGPSSQHHSAGTDAAAASYQNVHEDLAAENENKKREHRNKKIRSGGGYETPDPQKVEAARRRAEQPSEYAKLQ